MTSESVGRVLDNALTVLRNVEHQLQTLKDAYIEPAKDYEAFRAASAKREAQLHSEISMLRQRLDLPAHQMPYHPSSQSINYQPYSYESCPAPAPTQNSFQPPQNHASPPVRPLHPSPKISNTEPEVQVIGMKAIPESPPFIDDSLDPPENPTDQLSHGPEYMNQSASLSQNDMPTLDNEVQREDSIERLPNLEPPQLPGSPEIEENRRHNNYSAQTPFQHDIPSQQPEELDCPNSLTSSSTDNPAPHYVNEGAENDNVAGAQDVVTQGDKEMAGDEEIAKDDDMPNDLVEGLVDLLKDAPPTLTAGRTRLLALKAARKAKAARNAALRTKRIQNLQSGRLNISASEEAQELLDGNDSEPSPE